MQGRKYSMLAIAMLSVVLASASVAAVTLRLEGTTTPSGGIAAVSIFLDPLGLAPTSLVIPLNFDTSLMTVVAIVAGADDTGALIDYAPNASGATVVAYHPTDKLPAGHLATLYVEVASEVPAGTGITIADGGVSASNAAADPLVVTLAATSITIAALHNRHRADTDGNGRINLSEVLRVVQLYSLGEFRCDVTQEDGIAPGSAPRDCMPHNLDYAPQNWRFSLSELLRAIQFFNAFKGTYHPSPGTEDGFTSGLTR